MDNNEHNSGYNNSENNNTKHEKPLLKDEAELSEREISEGEISEPDTDEMESALKSKLSNYWYFYKWQTIIGVIIAIGIIVTLCQMSGNTSPDVAVMYVGPSYITVTDKDNMTLIAENYMIDYNDDGEKAFHFLEINVVPLSDENAVYTYEMNQEAQKRFTTEITAGNSLVYILEESFYRKLIELNVLASLGDVLDGDMIPAESEKYGVQVKCLDFFTQQSFSSIPDDCYICIRNAPSDDTLNYGRTIEYWNSNKVFFRSVFAYKK